MAITRIRLNTTATSTGCYTFILNPSSVDLQDKDDYILRKTLDAGQIKQTSYFNSLPVKLSWSRIPNGAVAGFSTMIATLYSYKNSVKYVHFGDVDYRANPTPHWQKYLVVDVEIGTESGGKIRKNVTVTLTPEPL